MLKPGLNVRCSCGCSVGKLSEESQTIRVVNLEYGNFDLADIMVKCKCSICGEVTKVDRVLFKHCVYSYYMISGDNYEAVETKPVVVRGEETFPEDDAQFRKLQFCVKRLPENVEPYPDTGEVYESFELCNDEFEIVRKIAEGSYGKVYEAKWTGSVGGGKTVAIKEMKLENAGENTKENVMKEFSTIMKMRYRHVIPVYGYTYYKKDDNFERIRIVMELMDGDIYRYVTKNTGPSKTRLTLYEKYMLLWKMTKGLHYLHERKVLHLDVKSYNFLQRNNGKEVVITDFGLSRPLQQAKTHFTGNFGGTLLWMAPELFKDNPRYRSSSDIYSFGITIYEVLFEAIPYTERNCRIQLVLMALIKEGTRPNVSDPNLPKELRSLMNLCWNQDRTQRPTTQMILSFFVDHHDIFQKNYDKVVKLDPKYGI